MHQNRQKRSQPLLNKAVIAFLSVSLYIAAYSSPLSAAIVLDSSASVAPTGGGSTSQTLTGIVIGNHPNRLLVISIGINFGTNTTEMTGCKFDPASTNVTMTKLVAMNQTTNAVSTYLWYLVAPAVGTYTVTCTTISSDRSAIVSYSLYNVDQSNPFRDSDSLAITSVVGSTGTGNLNQTTVTGDYCISGVAIRGNSVAPTDLIPGGSATQQLDIDDSGTLYRYGSSFFVATGTSTDMSWTWLVGSTAGRGAHVVAAVAPALTVIPVLLNYYRNLN